MAAEGVFLDTNMLTDATDEAGPRHRSAIRLIETKTDLVMSAQIAREYLVVATRPPAVNGLGLPAEDALDNLAEFRKALRLLPEESPVLPALIELLRQVPCVKVHRVPVLVTSNRHHFRPFEAIVRCMSIEDALGE